MHFRVRGNNVQVVKTVVDKKTLRSKSVPVGSANIGTGVLSEQLLSALTDEEIGEVRRWIESRQKTLKLRREVEARLLDQHIYDAIQWVKEAPAPVAREVVKEALTAMRSFQRTVVKLGLVKETPSGGAGR